MTVTLRLTPRTLLFLAARLRMAQDAGEEISSLTELIDRAVQGEFYVAHDNRRNRSVSLRWQEDLAALAASEECESLILALKASSPETAS